MVLYYHDCAEGIPCGYAPPKMQPKVTPVHVRCSSGAGFYALVRSYFNFFDTKS